mmetsp:Transcript_89351/g.289278  ORF Transcript_89351/g.289278 Transcript_89351/m.289278 type:complete len:440 (-) Transcript_89351:40-1359(-)
MIEYDEDWVFHAILRPDVHIRRALLFAVPAALLCVLLSVLRQDFVGELGAGTVINTKQTQTWTAATGVLTAVLLSFRTTQALSRFWEGTSLLHQLRGEWFDSISCCVTFSCIASKNKPREVKEFRHTIVRLMSLCHGSALSEISGDNLAFDLIDLKGITEETMEHLSHCHAKYGFNRVEMTLHILQTLINKALDDDILKIPAPILTRVYQTLSRGYVCLLNARKITDTRFPFPYAQLLALLLLFHTLLIPAMLTVLFKSIVWPAVFSFVAVFGMFFLNFVARELEDPFGHDDNDLPLSHFQREMNQSLLMLLHNRADHVAGLAPRCVRDFARLEMAALRGRPRMERDCSSSQSRLTEFDNYEFPQAQTLPPQLELDFSSGGAPDQRVSPEELARNLQCFTRALRSWGQVVASQVHDLRGSLSDGDLQRFRAVELAPRHS